MIEIEKLHLCQQKMCAEDAHVRKLLDTILSLCNPTYYFRHHHRARSFHQLCADETDLRASLLGLPLTPLAFCHGDSWSLWVPTWPSHMCNWKIRRVTTHGITLKQWDEGKRPEIHVFSSSKMRQVHQKPCWYEPH